MKAMILAAGLGSRLRPLTNYTPKALVRIANKTLLEINIGKLKRFGVEELVINTYYLGDQITQYLAENNNFGLKNVFISNEKELLDTGGGIFKAQSFLGNSPFIVYNVDIISSIDLGAMYEYHLKSNDLATLAVRNRTSNRLLLFDRNNNLAGIDDVKNNKIRVCNNNIEFKRYAFSGIHIISPDIFKLTDRTGAFSIIDLYLELAFKGLKINGFVHDDSNWFDIGTIEKLGIVENYVIKNSINILVN